MANYCIYPPGWKRRKIITPRTTNMVAALTDFPLLVTLANDPYVGRWGHSTGVNVRFAKPDGTLLYHERLWHTVASGLASYGYYVKRSLDPAGDNRIQVLYDNPGASDGQDKVNVWTGLTYKGVYHFLQDPSGTAPQMLDSSSNANHGTSNGSMNSGDLVTGKIYKALDFDGSNDNIALGDNSFDYGTNSFWAALWFKTASHAGYPCFISKESGYGTGGWNVVLDTNNGKLRPYIDDGANGGGGNVTFTSSPVLSDNAWHRVWVTWNRSGDMTGYIDDVSIGTHSISAYSSVNLTNANQLRVGMAGSGSANPVTGLIEGVQTGIGLPSAAWIKFDYHNQNAADNELDWSSEEVNSAGGMMGSAL